MSLRDPIVVNLLDSLSGEGPLHAQLYASIRSAILAGGLVAGTRLPSTRALASGIGVSRNTAEEAFARLAQEGYLERRVGDGTYVAALERAPRARRSSISQRDLSARGRLVARESACVEPAHVLPFNAGSADVRSFPYDTWHRLLVRRSRQSPTALLGYGDPAGYPPLREAVAAYLNASRGVRCSPEQVIILTSSQQAIDLTARLLLDPGDPVFVEEPGYPGARAAFRAAGAELVPVPVDDAGLRVDAMRGEAKLAYVTPSNQYPLAVTLSLERRLALLQWARECGGFIVEDDYNSEFRYDGRPVAAIQGLADDARVIYLGTFTKTMFPSIRVAYAVVPPALASVFARARAQVDGHTNVLTQAVLADFVAEGHFGAHLRRMRHVYRGRRDALLDELHRRLGARVTFTAPEGGFHVVLSMAKDDRELVRRGAEAGLDLVPISRTYLAASPAPGLLLGYTALTLREIRDGVRALARLL
jgi:GntR family transcriptional regulator/MocR family aminotransferase